MNNANKIFNVLLLCTGNSARSIMAEAVFNSLGRGRVRAFSAGSHPSGHVHPFTLLTLEKAGLNTAGLRSKHWTEFAQPDSPAMDFIFTVCDKAAGEACPAWPGQPLTGHWGFEDPAAFEGLEAEQLRIFDRVFREINTRVRLFLSLPLEKLDRLSLKHHIDDLGKTTT